MKMQGRRLATKRVFVTKHLTVEGAAETKQRLMELHDSVIEQGTPPITAMIVFFSDGTITNPTARHTAAHVCKWLRANAANTKVEGWVRELVDFLPQVIEDESK